MLVKIPEFKLYINPEKIVKIMMPDNEPNRIVLWTDDGLKHNLNMSKTCTYYNNLNQFIEDLRIEIDKEMEKGWRV